MRVISRITDSGNFWTHRRAGGPRSPGRRGLRLRWGRCGSSPAREGRGRQKPVGPALRTRIAIRGEVPPMSERFFDFWRVDVFTDTPMTGNPLAVYHRATGLSQIGRAHV